MATAVDSLAEELVCSICTDIFTDPVMLNCGHNYCRECILKVCEMQNQNSSCPECRRVFVKESLKRNRVLANLSQKAKDLSAAPLLYSGPVPLNNKFAAKAETKTVLNKNCKSHPNLPLEFFCAVHKVLLCRTCSTSQDHKNHHLQTIKPAAKKQRENLKTSLSVLTEKRHHFSSLQGSEQWKIQKIKRRSSSLIQHIQSSFARLHCFLAEKELYLIQNVKKQEEKAEASLKQTVTHIQEQVQAIEEEICTLQSIIDQKNDLQFLQIMLDVPKSREYIEPYLSEGESEEISLGLHEEFLQFAVWREMKNIISPVPGELTEKHQKTGLIHFESPERETDAVKSLMSDCSYYAEWNSTMNPVSFPLKSKNYYWEVEVQGKTEWRVGLSVYPGEAINYYMTFWDKVKTVINNLIDQKYLLLLKNSHEYYISTPRSTSRIHLQVIPQVIGLFVDCCACQVSFYNVKDMSLIYKIAEHFTGELYAYFDPGNNSNGYNAEPLKIPFFTVQYLPSLSPVR